MMVGFHNTHSVDNCGICLYSMDNSDVVAHDGIDGDKHPWHRDCIKGWMFSSSQNYCPSCRVSMDKNSLFTWKDRMIIELNHVKKDAYIGAASGGATGIAIILGAASTGNLALAIGAKTGWITVIKKAAIFIAIAEAILEMGLSNTRVETKIQHGAGLGAMIVAVGAVSGVTVATVIGTIVVGTVGAPIGGAFATVVDGFFVRRDLYSLFRSFLF